MENSKPKKSIDQESNVSKWIKEINDARKRERGFREQAKQYINIYEGNSNKSNTYNILYSNVETVAPALYNSTPRPVVKPKNASASNQVINEVCCKFSESVINYLLDTGDPSYSSFDEVIKSSVLDCLVTGRGVSRVKYHNNQPQSEVDASPYHDVLCYEMVNWDRFYHGFGRNWSEVTWVAFEHILTEQELKNNFPDKWEVVSEKSSEEGAYKQNNDGEPQLFCLYEIWDKSTKKVLFVSDNGYDEFLKEEQDPMMLPGFFPCPKPLSFFSSISGLTPVPTYRLYSEQAKELNLVSERINKIVSGMRVRGVYDSQIQELSKLMESEDNTLMPVENAALLFANGGSLDKAIMFLPIDRLVSVLQQLYLQRQQVKQVIYEITGIADIMRGSSAASETLGAQKLKSEWGTLRLKRLQQEVSRYVRDMIRLLLSGAVNILSPERLLLISGIEAPDRTSVKIARDQIKGMPPEQIPAELSQIISKPSIQDIIESVSDNENRSYSIDIETNSTVSALEGESQEEMSKFLNGVSQFIHAISPLVESGSITKEAASSIMMAVSNKFQFGREIQDQIKAASAGKEPNDQNAAGQAPTDPQQEQNALNQQMAQQAMQRADEEHKLKMRKIEAEIQIKIDEHNMNTLKMNATMQGVQDADLQ